jgi:DNA polymerase-3 subunit beta
MTTTTDQSTSTNAAPEAHAGAFTVGYRQLSEALKLTAVAAKSKALPVLQRVLVESDRAGARITAFDFDTAVTVEMEGTSARTRGRMLLEHAAASRVLAAAVKGASKRHLDGLEVRLEVVDGTPTLHVEGYAVPLDAALTPDQFPALPPTTPPTHVVDRAGFTGLFNRCRAVADRGDLLPILSAVRLQLEPGHIGATATDKYRLTIGQIPARGTTREQVLAPATTVATILGRLSAVELALGTDSVEGSVWLTLQAGSVTARVLTVDGTYPSVESVVARAGGDLTVTLPRVALLEAAGRAAAITTAAADKNAPARIVVDAGTITIEPGSGTERTCTAPAVAAQVGGLQAGWVAGVNPAFLLEAVSSIDAAEVTLHLGEPTRPLMFTAGGEVSDSSAPFRHIVMPVRFAS